MADVVVFVEVPNRSDAERVVAEARARAAEP
jgi:hypothetical protein